MVPVKHYFTGGLDDVQVQNSITAVQHVLLCFYTSVQLHQQICFLKLQPTLYIKETAFCQTLDLRLHPEGNTYRASVTSLILQLTFCVSVLPPITSCQSQYF